MWWEFNLHETFSLHLLNFIIDKVGLLEWAESNVRIFIHCSEFPPLGTFFFKILINCNYIYTKWPTKNFQMLILTDNMICDNNVGWLHRSIFIPALSIW